MPPESADSTLPGYQVIKAQLEALETFTRAGDHFHITPEILPDLDPLLLTLSRYLAYGNFINNYPRVREGVDDPSLRQAIDTQMTNEINTREENLKKSLEGIAGESDQEKIAHFLGSRLSLDQLRYLIELRNSGLWKQLNPEKLAELGALTPEEQVLFQLMALNTAMAPLEQSKPLTPPGLNEPASGQNLRQKLDSIKGDLERKRGTALESYPEPEDTTTSQ